MKLGNSTQAWGSISKLLHWLIVALLITQYTLAWIASGLPVGLEKLVVLSRHKSFGILILGLATVRLAWRLLNPTPALPTAVPKLQRLLARATHALLYGCLFALPLTGWIMSSARNFSVSFFNIFQLPDLVSPGEALYVVSRSVHVGLTWVLLGAVALHVAAALKHHFFDGDMVLRRMLPFTRT